MTINFLEKSNCYIHISQFDLLSCFMEFNIWIVRTTDTQWSVSKKPENLGLCGRQNMLWPYYKIGIGIWFLAVQWRQFPHRASVVRGIECYCPILNWCLPAISCQAMWYFFHILPLLCQIFSQFFSQEKLHFSFG